MRNTFLIACLAFLLFPYSSFTQEYSYTHYDISDGLAGSTVYSMVQDKDGFIWISTETGVSRFDGTHFLNFTTADGLPDLEILNMFSDSKGRVWMAPFRKSVCYYYKGLIYNADKDSILRKVHFNNNIESFAEDTEGSILMQARNGLHLLRGNGEVREYSSIKGRPITACAAICRSTSGHFLVQEHDSLFELAEDSFRLIRPIELIDPHASYVALSARSMASRTKEMEWGMKSFATGKTTRMPFERNHYRHISFTILGDSLVYLNETTGSTEYNINTGASKKFLPGVEVSRVFRDGDGDTWFTTLGHGIFRLNSIGFKNLTISSHLSEKYNILAINKWGNELFLGTDRNMGFRFELPSFNGKRSTVPRLEAKSRIIFIDQMGNGDILFISSFLVYMCSHDLGTLKRGETTLVSKAAFKKNDNDLFIAGSEGLVVFNKQDFRVTDTIWHERATAVYWRNDSTFVGTLNGLYLLTKEHLVTNLGAAIPFLRKRIASIVSSADGTIWIASNDAGVLGYKNGHVIATFDKAQGLTSNICRTLYANKNCLWVGTEKGLNKIDLEKPGRPVTRYTSNDGLGSDIINTVYVDGSMVYVGTPAGLSYFDESKINLNGGCHLMWLGLINSGRDRLGDTANMQLSYKDNNIRFEYVGISYKSAGNIQYRYRLVGLDTTWKETKETYLDYPSLPSGKYELQLEATNKFGKRSNPLSLHFVVTTPFWRTAWFDGVIFLAILAIMWKIVSFRIGKIRERQEEREKYGKKMMEMEQMALRAQMNPHFIFNCMTSIQQYILDKDIFAANKYITGFARLIRATLQNSTQDTISLDEEIAFLASYLSLEKLRFKEKMDFSIEVDPFLNEKEIFIPPMLIQPFVENSMRHGLRHKTDGNGHIFIKVCQANGNLEFIIEDNGIGRAKAAQFKTREHIEYQSKGMSLTADRIRLMNSMKEERILLEVTDLLNEKGEAIGTRVVIRFPKSDLSADVDDCAQALRPGYSGDFTKK